MIKAGHLAASESDTRGASGWKTGLESCASSFCKGGIGSQYVAPGHHEVVLHGTAPQRQKIDAPFSETLEKGQQVLPAWGCTARSNHLHSSTHHHGYRRTYPWTLPVQRSILVGISTPARSDNWMETASWFILTRNTYPWSRSPGLPTFAVASTSRSMRAHIANPCPVRNVRHAGWNLGPSSDAPHPLSSNKVAHWIRRPCRLCVLQHAHPHGMLREVSLWLSHVGIHMNGHGYHWALWQDNCTSLELLKSWKAPIHSVKKQLTAWKPRTYW